MTSNVRRMNTRQPMPPVSRPVHEDPDARGPVPPSRVGTAIHSLIGELAVASCLSQPPDLWDAAWEGAGRLIPTAEFGRRARAARISVASAACVYVARFLPPRDWTLLGTEVGVGKRHRVDLAWRTPAGEVVYDEVKDTFVLIIPRGDSDHRRQARRYAALGEATEPRFGGVRLLYLGSPTRSLLVHAYDEAWLIETPYWVDGAWTPPESVS